MNCACIGILRAERLDDSYRWILRQYQNKVIENTCWFSIELEWHIKSTYTNYEKQQLIEVFGQFPKQEILIFGECDRIFVAAHEIIKHSGGLLSVNLGDERATINSYPGLKTEIWKDEYEYQLNHNPDYYLVDHIFIREYFNKGDEQNFERFKLDPFLPNA